MNLLYLRRKCSPLATLLLLGIPLLLSPAAGFAAQESAVIAPGSPPLTQDMAERADRFLEWIFDMPFTRQQHDAIRAELAAAWKKKDTDAIKGVVDLLALQEQLGKMSAAERQAARGGLRSAFVEELRKDPEDPMNASLVAAYDAAHRPLIPGNPPLTRQMTDAYAEMTWFVLAEIVGETDAPTPDKPFKDAWAGEIAKQYAGLEVGNRRRLAELPLAWAALRLAWPTLPEREKAALRSRWKEAFAPVLPKTLPATAAAADPPAKKGPWTPMSDEKPPATADSAQRVAWLRRKVAAQQAAYRSLSDMALQHGAARFNVSAILSGSPYRYEVRYR